MAAQQGKPVNFPQHEGQEQAVKRAPRSSFHPRANPGDKKTKRSKPVKAVVKTYDPGVVARRASIPVKKASPPVKKASQKGRLPQPPTRGIDKTRVLNDPYCYKRVMTKTQGTGVVVDVYGANRICLIVELENGERVKTRKDAVQEILEADKEDEMAAAAAAAAAAEAAKRTASSAASAARTAYDPSGRATSPSGTGVWGGGWSWNVDGTQAQSKKKGRSTKLSCAARAYGSVSSLRRRALMPGGSE